MAETDYSTNSSRLPRRRFGETETKLSILGMGAIVVVTKDQPHANRLVAEAVEKGVNYFDVAPMYGRAEGCEGDGEIKLGPALKPYRKEIFLACKTTFRDRVNAEFEFNRSLERLQTDYFDLYQLHGIAEVERDVDGAFAKGGVMEMILEKQKSGQIRYIGFSAHSTEAAVEAFKRFEFDSALFAINFASWMKGGYGPEIVEAAQSRGAACLALKAMARQKWPDGDPRQGKFRTWYEPIFDPELMAMALRWTLRQQVTSALPPGEESLFRTALDIAMERNTLLPGEEESLRQLAKTLNPLFP
jgi:aryl-alcohol dehydrogenase-like predicted oxidoreductase